MALNDSVITPRPEAGVVTRLKMNLRSPSLSVSESGNEELCSELSIFEHSPVVLSCPNEMRAFLTGRPQTWVDYALTMNEIAETDGEKRYWLFVRRLIS